MDSKKLAECFQNTMEIAASGMMKRYRRQTERSTKVYPEKYKSEKRQKEMPSQIIVEENTTLAAASKYLSENKTAVLNFANPVTPGGGVINGAMAQEECLCRSSDLFLFLTAPECDQYYQYHRNYPNHFYSDRPARLHILEAENIQMKKRSRSFSKGEYKIYLKRLLTTE